MHEIQRNDGKGYYPFTDDCDRYENGGRATNVPLKPGQAMPDPLKEKMYSSAWGCKKQFESGLMHFVSRIRDRRFVAVDRERGIVFTFNFFDHGAGNTRYFKTPDGRDVVAPEIAQDAQAPMFLISTRTEEQVSAGLRRAFWGWGVFGLILSLGGWLARDLSREQNLGGVWPLYALTGWLLDNITAMKHSTGIPLVKVYGPTTTEARGGAVTVNFYNASGQALDHRFIEEAANKLNISLRTGCFCNPGAGELALGISRVELDVCFNGPGHENRLSIDDFRVCIDGKSSGAVRISVGSGFDPSRSCEFSSVYPDWKMPTSGLSDSVRHTACTSENLLLLRNTSRNVLDWRWARPNCQNL